VYSCTVQYWYWLNILAQYSTRCFIRTGGVTFGGGCCTGIVAGVGATEEALLEEDGEGGEDSDRGDVIDEV
jgi:hypothetical protein